MSVRDKGRENKKNTGEKKREQKKGRDSKSKSERERVLGTKGGKIERTRESEIK